MKSEMEEKINFISAEIILWKLSLVNRTMYIYIFFFLSVYLCNICATFLSILFLKAHKSPECDGRSLMKTNLACSDDESPKIESCSIVSVTST